MTLEAKNLDLKRLPTRKRLSDKFKADIHGKSLANAKSHEN